MMKINMNLAVLLLVFAILMVSCTKPATNRAPLVLTPCKLGITPALCGTLRVYENRDAQRGRRINIRVAVIKAKSPDAAPDPIFYLAGGPGGSAVEDGMRQQFSSSLSYTHDIVFVEQRGTGNSNPKTVSQGFPDFQGLIAEQIDANVKARAWEYKVLQIFTMDTRFYTTSMAMDDLDDVRKALGYDKINLVGYSYGATAAQYYLRQHEDHVRTVTLGIGSLLDIPVFELWALNGQRAMELIINRCLADSACQAAFPNLREEFTGLLTQLATTPATVSFTYPGNQQLDRITFTPDYFAAFMRHMTTDAKNDPFVPKLIHQAYDNNDWSGFAQYLADGYGPQWWGNLAMEHTIRCSEKWASFDPAVVAELSKGSYLAGWDISLANHQAYSCSFTPQGYTPEGETDQPGSNVPVLIINGDLDPINPPENMAGAKELWPNSLSLIGKNQSHSWSNMDEITCWFSILDQFINNGSVVGLDSSCMKVLQSPPFDTQ